MFRNASTWPTTTIKKSSYLRGRIGWQGLRASEFVDHGPFLITGTDFLESGRIEWSRCYHVSEERFREGAYIHVRDEDLLITKDGTIGKIAYVRDCPEKAVLNSGVFLLRCSDGSYQHRFLYHLLRSDLFDTFLRVNLAGSTINHLYQYIFERFEFPVPDEAVQQRIAEILSTVDEAIEQTEALIAKTQQIKAGLMHDLFTRGVTSDGQLRPPHEEAPQFYKESPLGWIPKEWEAGYLVDRRQNSRPHIKTGPFGSSLKLEHWVDEGVPVITIGALGEGEFIQSQLLFVSEETAERLREYRLSEGDIVFSRVADVGRSAVITSGEAGWIMSSNLMRISLDSASVVPAFLQAQLAYDFRVRAQIRATVNAGGREVANSSILNRLHFSWPEWDEQQRIVDRLRALEERRVCLMEDLQKLRHQKTGLMHDLLSGRVSVVNIAAPNVAEVQANV